MTAFVFVGDVWEAHDAYRVDNYLPVENTGDLWIGPVDFIAVLDDAKFNGPVIVGIGDERFITTADDFHVQMGWGYSEYTPMDPDSLWIESRPLGWPPVTHDLLEIIRSHVGKQIVLTVSDEAINLLELPRRREVTE